MTILARAGILWLRFKAWWRKTLYRIRVRLFGRLAVEAATEGKTAIHAVDTDSPEGDIQAAAQRAAWTTQIARLEAIDARNRDQEYLLRQLRRNVRELDAREAQAHATPAGLGGQRLAAFGAVGQRRSFLGPIAAANPLLALATNPIAWMAAAFVLLAGWGGWNHARAERMEHQRDEARADVERLERANIAANAERDMLADAVRAADALSRQTAENLNAANARARRAAEQETRRVRELRQIDAGGPPPSWERSLRDAGEIEAGPSGDSGAASTNPQ